MHVFYPLLGAAVLLYAGPRALRRLQLSRAKAPSLEGHPRWARRLARQVPLYEFDESGFFGADGAPADVQAQRRRGFETLTALYAQRFPKSAQMTAEAAESLSDFQFTARYRVPFPFSRLVRERLKGGSFLSGSDGSTITDLDGNRLYDLTGSYGVNVFGYDFYKACIRAGVEVAEPLGPVLGGYHPLTVSNARRLRAISGMDEVSFHMSGTEAVMQAVRLARYHSRRRYLVRFSGAYHGWWGDVQPGVGNPVTERDSLTLRDMSPEALRVLRTRRDIACVLINPLQALHPNRGAPGDSALVDGARSARFDRAAYAGWLRQLRAVCSERGIALIFDEVFLGFRLARGGAQEYFGVHADLVTYGKTVAGGLPIGVVCGRAQWMRRFRPDRPADICFARGTFNSHPYVMAAMHEFLRRLDEPAVQQLYAGLDTLWDRRATDLNRRLAEQQLPVQVAALSTVWTVCYTRPSRYHWMLQYYLRAHGLALSWVGSGRLIFNLSFTDADFDAVAERFVAACRDMLRDGWWSAPAELTNRRIRRRIVREMLQARWASVIGSSSSPRSR